MQDGPSPRLKQFSHGTARLHLSFLFLHGVHDNGIRFLLRTTRYGLSGERTPLLDGVVDGGVGDMLELFGV